MDDTNTEIIKSIGSDSLEILSDGAELILDSTIDSEILKDIPIFGSLFKLAKIGLTIRDRLFINKLNSFFVSIKSIKHEERQKFVRKYLKDPKRTHDLGEKLISTLDKIDSNKKATMVGKAFSLFLQGKIEAIDFYDLTYTIENFKLHYSDILIETCLNIEKYPTERPEIVDHFLTCGLLFSKNEKQIYIYQKDEVQYSNERITDIGKLFMGSILDFDKDKLKKKYIRKILHMSPITENGIRGWTFVKTIPFKEFKSTVEKMTLKEILEFSFHYSQTTFYKNEEAFRITKNEKGDLFSLYKFGVSTNAL